jgi:predicted transcriptional regulator
MTQQDLLQATRQLTLQELREYSAQVVAIYQERESAAVTTEAPLLDVVHRSLSPQTKARWDELLAKRDDASLTPSEYEELLQLTDEVEALNVQRMTAVSQLAQARGVDLRTMMRQLNLPEPVYG